MVVALGSSDGAAMVDSGIRSMEDVALLEDRMENYEFHVAHIGPKNRTRSMS